MASRPSHSLIIAARQAATHEWWDGADERFSPYISSVVLSEIEDGDPDAAADRLRYAKAIAVVEVVEDSYEIARVLIEDRLLPRNAQQDALHIAVAAAHSMKYLVSWNLKHIANPETRFRIMNRIISLGFQSPVICTPEELL